MRRTRGNGRTTAEAKAAGFVSERAFQKTVVEYAQATGWLCYHQVDMGFKDPETGRQSYSRRIGSRLFATNPNVPVTLVVTTAKDYRR